MTLLPTLLTGEFRDADNKCVFWVLTAHGNGFDPCMSRNEDSTIWDMKGAWICTNKIFSFQAPKQRDTVSNALIFDKFDEIIWIGSHVPLIKLSESIKKSDTYSWKAQHHLKTKNFEIYLERRLSVRTWRSLHWISIFMSSSSVLYCFMIEDGNTAMPFTILRIASSVTL